MEQYIKKSALVAEIERRQKEEVSYDENGSFASWADENHYLTLESIKNFIDTLEVKEVNNVWHDANETPKGAGDKEILVQFADSHASVLEIDDWEYLDHQTKWAYLKDLI